MKLLRSMLQRFCQKALMFVESMDRKTLQEVKEYIALVSVKPCRQLNPVVYKKNPVVDAAIEKRLAIFSNQGF